MGRGGKCHQPLPWITDAGDATFGEVADGAKIPVIVDLWGALVRALPYGQPRA